MRRLVFFVFIIFAAGCRQRQDTSKMSPVHVNEVLNKIDIKSDTILTVTFTAPPPKGLKTILLVSGALVLRTVDVDPKLKQGAIIEIHYPFKKDVHYGIFAVGLNLQDEYYDMRAYDFLIDVKKKAILLLKTTAKPATKI